MKRGLTFLLLLASGCVGDPDLAGHETQALLAGAPEVDRASWELAPAGCEDAPADAELARTAGEPLLGALIDRAGAVVCVDSLSILLHEVDVASLPSGDYGADPSPQPSHPGDHASSPDALLLELDLL